VTVIESICASGAPPIPPVIIVQGKHHIESWYRDNLIGDELLLLSENGFTTDVLTFRYLEHFIEHTKASPSQPYKLLLMDNHGSHLTPYFILHALRHNVVPLSFLPHLTHVMQPLDVGCFQPYKHWHNKAVNFAIAMLEFDYTIASFLRDLAEVRACTFTKHTIKEAFRKSGMWPPRVLVKAAMAKFVREKEAPLPEPKLPILLVPCTPKTIRQVEAKQAQLRKKTQPSQSSPTRAAFDSLDRGTNQLLIEGEWAKQEAAMLHARVEELTRKRPTNRRRLQKGGEMTGQQAQARIQEKDMAERTKAVKAELKMLQKTEREALKLLHEVGIVCRRGETLRKRMLKERDPEDRGWAHLQWPVPDVEKITLYEQSRGLGIQFQDLDTENLDSFNHAELQDSIIQGVDVTSMPGGVYYTGNGADELEQQHNFIPFDARTKSSDNSEYSFDSDMS
jgi:uncharacterized surface protein with fasciclin (FAS1) repeats